ncbi:MAG: hypothetical protein H6815_14595 [Phycisphaeraceae bacterium]|nr:hypothetical protein [Phycisphaerales bacterium]MCB9861669.1 hypothetical protein [Phycisphaeraceae bacterium]
MDRRGVPTRVVAAAFALSAFSVAVLSGIWASNPTGYVLKVALASSFLCYFAGLIIGSIGERAALGHIRDFEKNNPVPDVEAEIAAALQSEGEDGFEIVGSVGDVGIPAHETKEAA